MERNGLVTQSTLCSLKLCALVHFWVLKSSTRMRTEMGCLERRTLGAKLIILPMAASPLEHVALPKGQQWPTSCWQSCSLLLILLPSCARRKVVRAAAFALLLSLHSPGSSYSGVLSACGTISSYSKVSPADPSASWGWTQQTQLCNTEPALPKCTSDE